MFSALAGLTLTCVMTKVGEGGAEVEETRENSAGEKDGVLRTTAGGEHVASGSMIAQAKVHWTKQTGFNTAS